MVVKGCAHAGGARAQDGGRKELDIKRYAKVEKIPGGNIEDSRVLKGVMMNKDLVHAKMRRKIERRGPRPESRTCTRTLASTLLTCST